MTRLDITLFLLLLFLLSICVLTIESFHNRVDIYPDDGEFEHKVTIVSGHWALQRSKHTIQEYFIWWENILGINAPMVFYTNDRVIVKTVSRIRHPNRKPTSYVYRDIEEEMYPLFPEYKEHWSSHDVPGKDVGIIWLNKLFMIKDAIATNTFETDWFVWCDAGNAFYRKPPAVGPQVWPHPDALFNLPKDRFIYTSSWVPFKYHSIAGTAFMYHSDIASLMEDYFMKAWSDCVSACKGKRQCSLCGSDQILLSHIKNEHPELFFQAGYGYGNLIAYLFEPCPLQYNITKGTDVCIKENGITLKDSKFCDNIADALSGEEARLQGKIPKPYYRDSQSCTLQWQQYEKFDME